MPLVYLMILVIIVYYQSVVESMEFRMVNRIINHKQSMITCTFSASCYHTTTFCPHALSIPASWWVNTHVTMVNDVHIYYPESLEPFIYC